MVTGLYWRDNKDGNGFKPMSYYSDYFDRLENLEIVICPYCGATDEEDLDLADHAGDCPHNPFGYNHPDFMENCEDSMESIEEGTVND